MHFAKDIYISENLTDKSAKIMREIKYGKGFYNCYLVYKNTSTNSYEFMKGLYFKQKAFQSIPLLIEAIISDKSEAMEFIARKTADSMDVIYDD